MCRVKWTVTKIRVYYNWILYNAARRKSERLCRKHTRATIDVDIRKNKLIRAKTELED